jgi:hypothetical protein
VENILYKKEEQSGENTPSGKGLFFLYILLECVGHSFAYVAHFVFLRDVWIPTQIAAVASRRASSLATYP